MEKITAQQAAEKWQLSVRTVQDRCKKGHIPGAERWGRVWMIPADALPPEDGRCKASKNDVSTDFQPLPRKSPFLNITDLYSIPGTADECIRELSNHPEAQALFAAQIACGRGDIDIVYNHAQKFLNSTGGLYRMIGGSILLAYVAIWKGDIWLWRAAHRHFLDAPCKNAVERDIVALSIAVTDLTIRDTDEFPDWFIRGCFDNLPRDSHPAARVYYVRNLLITAQELAQGNAVMEGFQGLGLMRALPFMIEPMISQMVVDKVILAEIYLRLSCAVAYRQCGNNQRAAEHLDRAIALCMPDGLYAPLVEHRRMLGPFLDDRLSLVDPEAVKKVKLLHRQYHSGWVKIHNAVLDRQVQVTLSSREQEVVRLTAFGLTDSQIAAQLHISESSVKAAIKTAKNKTGVNSRKKLADFI